MSKKSLIARNVKRIRLSKKYKKKRKMLKKKGDYLALAKLPRDSSPVRVRNRCSITGRGRGYVGQVGVSRNVFHKLFNEGYLPGFRKEN